MWKRKHAEQKKNREKRKIERGDQEEIKHVS